jgi:hypothetical protein
MIITIYKISNGEILRVVSAPDDMIALQINQGEDYIVGDFADDLFYISNGKAIQKPLSPNDDYVWNPDTKKWVYSKTTDDLANDAIIKRNDLLLASDWTQLQDAPADKQAWAEYRQHLRDVTQQSGFPITIDWGTPPNEV